MYIKQIKNVHAEITGSILKETHQEENFKNRINVNTSKRAEAQKESLQEDPQTTNCFKSMIKAAEKQELDMENDFKKRIQAAFKPRGESEDEVYPTVVKPKWGNAVHDGEISGLLKESIQSVKKMAEKEKLSQSEAAESWTFQKALEILEPYLQPTNPQAHHPVPRITDEAYQSLKFLWTFHPASFLRIRASLSSRLDNKWEVQRRLVTVTTQITQKTIVENWMLIRNALLDGLQNERRTSLKFYEVRLQLAREFPNIVYYSDLFLPIFSRILEDEVANTGQTLLPFLRSWMGDHESSRRLKTPISERLYQLKIELSQDLSENLRASEIARGVDVWTVHHWIKCLGLGQPKKLDDWTDDEVLFSMEKLQKLIAGMSRNEGIPWHESASRAWLIETFGQEIYTQQLDLLCNKYKQIRARLVSHEDHRWKNNGSSVIKILDGQEEDKLKFADHGLDFKLIQAIKIIRSVNQQFRADWNSLFDSCPSKLTSNQKDFIKIWFADNFI
ncbi:uncharacterized protein PGTG_11712 [Puccinia graminis f. sp. tritici CRL 75-36-700-3]|uniref:Uncharacterized protein n=1 Tax=Puccinia graminis f. sp. tritici (strain CRL 75-36-700-3 / race SCCL) TaxID=418459 RepID=E3KNT1_PUCGT|nr:uncharacterized protein PGTG_11712 [Puccinia graminis f. sp. tritici CRL 75-36-700-3]EFP85956.1 hypothetical protein PGTG_11712 [Puccinia graminis f. sp. tritici CRL 75-36-700-3]